MGYTNHIIAIINFKFDNLASVSFDVFNRARIRIVALVLVFYALLNIFRLSVFASGASILLFQFG